jgi:outer membrane protein assembly factor BamD (BamD/ComL family)
VYLNYAIILYNNGKKERAKEIFKEAEKIFSTLDEDEKEPEMLDQRSVLMEMLGI